MYITVSDFQNMLSTRDIDVQNPALFLHWFQRFKLTSLCFWGWHFTNWAFSHPVFLPILTSIATIRWIEILQCRLTVWLKHMNYEEAADEAGKTSIIVKLLCMVLQ